MGRPLLSSPARQRPRQARNPGMLVLWLLLPALTGCVSPLGPPLLLAGSLLLPGRLLRDSCPRLSSLDGSQTPEQLYRGVSACMRSAERDSAVVLFSLAAAYGRYDALRVADPTAHQAGALLRLMALQQLDDSQRQALSTGIAEALSEPGRKPDLCATIERVGPPTYQPDYMLRHGQMALRRSLSGNRTVAPAPPSGLVPGFDGDAAWNQVLDRVLRCSKA